MQSTNDNTKIFISADGRGTFLTAATGQELEYGNNINLSYLPSSGVPQLKVRTSNRAYFVLVSNAVDLEYSFDDFDMGKMVEIN